MSSKLFGVIPRNTLDKPDSATQRIIGDRFLNELFTDELQLIREAASDLESGKVLEIGAAGGNTKNVWPEVTTTDVRMSIGVDKVMAAEVISEKDNSISLLFGMDALHHVREPEKHFQELQRVLISNGVAIYIEPNWNLFSRFCFKVLLKYLHPEPYNTKKTDWNLTDPDPMMGNQSQAYNIFVRDKEIFELKYPNLIVEILQPIKGFAFLLSGGVHTRLPIPSRLLIWIYRKENNSQKWISTFGLGRLVKITKR
jgi:2-polyprenyl-3-methyl-5-hydroxy-6-metoxy-1,4-benzoquinol methylase